MKLSLPKIVTVALISGMIAFAGYAAYVFATSTTVGDVTGYACSINIGCISLNSQTSGGATGWMGVQPSSFGVQYDTSSDTFSGSGWSPSVGTVNFGVSCPADIVAAEGSSASGAKCASVPLANNATGIQNGGWDGYIYLGGVTLSGTSFTGRGWEGINTDGGSENPSNTGVGWLTFDATYNNPNNPLPTLPDVTLITTTPTILTGATGSLTWTVNSVVTSCTATSALGPDMTGSAVSNAWTGISSADLVAMVNSGVVAIPNMTAQTTFQLTCSDGLGNQATATATIDVEDPALCTGSNQPPWCQICESSTPPAWCESACSLPNAPSWCAPGKLKPIYKEN